MPPLGNKVILSTPGYNQLSTKLNTDKIPLQISF